jgi:hypothetical protein
MKSIYSVKLTVILCLCTTAAASAGMINFSLTPASQNLMIGQTAQVELWAKSTSSSTEVFGLQVIVAFDNTKLQYTSSVNQGVFDVEGAAPLSSALVWSGQNLGANEVIPFTPVHLATLKFLATDVVTSTSIEMLPSSGAVDTGAYDITDESVATTLGPPIDVTVITPEPTTVLSFLLLAAGGLCRRRAA